MGLSEINRLVDEGNSRKDYANAYAANYPVFLEAAELYKKAHDLCILSTEIGEPEETLLTSIYKFEELECRYYFYIKEEKYHKARKLNELQKKSIDKFRKFLTIFNRSINRNQIRISLLLFLINTHALFS